MDSQNPTVFGSLWAGALVLFEFYTDDTLKLSPGYFAVRSGSFLAVLVEVFELSATLLAATR